MGKESLGDGAGWPGPRQAQNGNGGGNEADDQECEREIGEQEANEVFQRTPHIWLTRAQVAEEYVICRSRALR